MEVVEQQYKDTKIGMIPVEWEYIELQSILDLLTDFEANGSFASVKNNVTVYNSINHAWYVRATDLENKTSLSNVKYVDEHSYNFLTKSFLKGGEVVITKRGEIGKVYLIPELNIPATVAPNLYLLRLNKKAFEKYIYYFFKSNIGFKALSRINSSTTLGALYKNDVKKLRLPLPPLPEQKKIATILSTVDEQIATTTAIIQQSQQLKKGLMQQLFSKGIGHTTFKQTKIGEIPESWEVVNLEEVTNKIGDGLHGTPKYVDKSNYRFINGNNLVNGKIRLDHKTKFVSESEYIKNNKNLNNQTILISINGTIGNIAFYNSELVMLGKSAAYINLINDIDKFFMFYQFQTRRVSLYFDNELTGTTIKNLSLRSIRNAPIIIPPLSEQKKIATILTEVDDKIQAEQQQKVRLEQLKKGLMQVLLTGQVRVNI